MYVRLDIRNRLTLPKEAAELFENGLVSVQKKKGEVVLKPVKEPFSNLAGMIKPGRPFLEIRRELAKELDEGKVEW